MAHRGQRLFDADAAPLPGRTPSMTGNAESQSPDDGCSDVVLRLSSGLSKVVTVFAFMMYFYHYLKISNWYQY
jgi:hypothetical protein